MTTDPDPIFHLALAGEWASALDQGTYERSTIGLSIDEVGFMHLSYGRQVQGTADRYYGEADDVVLLRVDPARIDQAMAPLRIDPVGEDHYPHLYGPLPVAAVVEVTPLTRGDDGRWQTGF